jgi:hypothetical protein
MANLFFKILPFSTFKLWLVFFCGLCLFYFPAKDICVFDDIANFYNEFKTIGWAGVSNSFGFSSNYYTHSILMICLYKLFGNQQVYYYLLGCGWHASNGVLLFIFLKKSILRFFINSDKQISILLSAIWVFSCMQTDNVLYIGALQYQLVGTLFFTGFLLMQHWMNTIKVSAIILFFFLLFFVLCLFAQEMSIILPWMLLVIAAAYSYTFSTNTTWSPFFFKLFIPMQIAVIGYFVWHWHCFGNWLPHYGQEHLKGFQLANILENYWINVCKTMIAVNFWPADLQQNCLLFGKNTFGILLIVLSISILLIFLGFKQTKQKGLLVIAILCLFILVYIPVSNIGNYDLHPIFNDRLLYFARPWIYIIFALLVYFIIGRYAYIVGAFFLIVQMLLLTNCVNDFHNANKYFTVLQSNCKKYKNDNLIFLNLPFQYKGIMLCRYPYSIHHLQNVCNDFDCKQNYVSVSREMINDTHHGNYIKKLSDSSIIVKNLEPKNSWILDGCQQSKNLGSCIKSETLPNNEGYILTVRPALKPFHLLYICPAGLQEFQLGLDSTAVIAWP